MVFKLINYFLTNLIILLYRYVLYNKIMFPPSIMAHIFNGILILIIVWFGLLNYNTLTNMKVYQKLILLLLFALTIGLHGLSHLGLEVAYQVNKNNTITQ